MTTPRTVAVRLWEKIAKADEDGCWLFSGGINHASYGLLNVDGRARLAHRLAYEDLVGPIPSGLCVLHSCDTPACCNPAHLFLGDRAANNRDARQKGRACAPPANRLRGAANRQAKLCEADVLAIRMRVAAGEKPRTLASAFGVSDSQVYLILNRRRWGWL